MNLEPEDTWWLVLADRRRLDGLFGPWSAKGLGCQDIGKVVEDPSSGAAPCP